MATFVFNGTENLAIDNFDPATDTVVIDDVNVADVASLTQTNSSVTLTLTSGVVLTLGGVIFASLTPTSLQPSGSSDLAFAIGTTGDDNPLDGNVVIGLAGNDTINITTADALVFGNEGTDIINGTFGGAALENLRINGGADGDQITGFGTGSVVFGGTGVDQITAAATSAGVTIYGNEGADVLIGGNGDDTIFGGQDNDSITGGTGNDVVYGNLGDDTIVGGTGDSTFFGGQDNDSIIGGAGDEAIYGNLGNDIIVTSAGVDTLVGGAGDDSIGGAVVAGVQAVGNLEAGSVIYGGLGEDVINVSVAGGLAGAQTSIFGGNNIVGAVDGDDTITVTGTLDVSIFGNEGNDTILGGAGSNTIYGGMGNDSLTGASGDDEITTLVGGQGDDIFVAGAINVSAGTDIGYSLVTDFTKGSDTIEFSTDPTTFATVTVGAAQTFDTVQAVITAYEGQLAANGALAVIVQSGGLAGETVLIHATAAGTADEVIVLTGAQNQLDLSDFS